MQALAARERLVQAEHLDERARHYLDLKLEGIREAPVERSASAAIASRAREILGRHTIPDTDLYSTCLAIENLWLAARAEGIGIGWVSFYREDDVRALLGIPRHVDPGRVAVRRLPRRAPGSTRARGAAAGARATRSPRHVFAERWGAGADPETTAEAAARPSPAEAAAVRAPGWWDALAAAVEPGDAAAAIRVRDASDELVKPAGSLGALETLLERWAAATGEPPAGHAGDRDPRRVRRPRRRGQAACQLFPARVSAQVAAAAARGETAIGVLARALGAELIVADVGLRGPRSAAASATSGSRMAAPI